MPLENVYQGPSACYCSSNLINYTNTSVILVCLIFFLYLCILACNAAVSVMSFLSTLLKIASSGNSVSTAIFDAKGMPEPS